jgi:Trk K+ transport system NAD-binding subunit
VSTTNDVVPLSMLKRGDLEVVEVKLQPNSPALSIPIRNLTRPSGCLLTAIVRENHAQIVTGDPDCGRAIRLSL